MWNTIGQIITYVSDHTSQQNAIPFDAMQYDPVLCTYAEWEDRTGKYLAGDHGALTEWNATGCIITRIFEGQHQKPIIVSKPDAI